MNVSFTTIREHTLVKMSPYKLSDVSRESCRLSTGVLISPEPDQEGNKLQRPNSNFCKPLKKKKIISLSVQPGLRGSNDLRVGRKMATVQLFFRSGRAKDLYAPLYLAYNSHDKPLRSPCCNLQFACVEQ